MAKSLWRNNPDKTLKVEDLYSASGGVPFGASFFEPENDLSGSITATSSVSGGLTVTRKLFGSAIGTAVSSGSASFIKTLEGAVNGASWSGGTTNPVTVESSNFGRLISGVATWSHTTTNSSMLLVFTGNRGSVNAGTLTYNGTALTRLAFTSGTVGTWSDVWYLANPPIGIYNLVLTRSGQAEAECVSVGLINASGITDSIARAYPYPYEEGDVKQVQLSSTPFDLVLAGFSGWIFPFFTDLPNQNVVYDLIEEHPFRVTSKTGAPRTNIGITSTSGNISTSAASISAVQKSALTVTRLLGGTVNGTSAVNGSANTTHNLGSSILGTSQVTGNTRVTRFFGGAVSGVSSVVGKGQVLILLGGYITGIASVTGLGIFVPSPIITDTGYSTLIKSGIGTSSVNNKPLASATNSGFLTSTSEQETSLGSGLTAKNLLAILEDSELSSDLTKANNGASNI